MDDILISRESLIAWAERKAKEKPIRTTIKNWDVSTNPPKPICEDNPNTPALVLADVLQQAAINSYMDYSTNELRDEITSLAWAGTKGYSDYTIDEAIEEMTEILEDYEINTISELEEELYRHAQG